VSEKSIKYISINYKIFKFKRRPFVVGQIKRNEIVIRIFSFANVLIDSESSHEFHNSFVPLSSLSL